MTGTNTIRFIAPNGARVVVRDWAAFCKAHRSGVALQTIFNDPVFGAMA